MVVPEIDSEIGMLAYSTDFSGIGGTIRHTIHAFRVSEVLDSSVLSRIGREGRYAVYTLEKRGIDTPHAIRRIHERTGLRLKHVGLKDARAYTTQYVSATRSSRSVDRFSDDRLTISRMGFLDRPLTGRDMIGNRFSIRVYGHTGDLSAFSEFDHILNYFGYQRFGSRRPVSHMVGRELVRGDFGRAASLLLSSTSKYDSEERNRVRRSLEEVSDYTAAAGSLPPGMDLERLILDGLARYGDPRTAFGGIPLEMRRFFVQAYQSYIFNLAISRAHNVDNLLNMYEGDVSFDAHGDLGRHAMGDAAGLAVPLVGYSYYKKTRFDGVISEVLKSEGVKPSDFFIKEMQEISAEGGFRHATIQCADASIYGDTVEFLLSRGSYATVVMREILKPADPLSAGF